MADVADGLKPANENPWYVLMTLYGEQDGKTANWKTHEKNRRAWNAIVGSFLSKEQIAQAALAQELLESEFQVSSEERNTLRELFHKVFLERNRGSRPVQFPNFDEKLNLSSTNFEHRVILKQMVFLKTVDCCNSIFAQSCSFENTTFLGEARLRKVRFSKVATFNKAYFSGEVSFRGTQFCGETYFKSTTFEKGAIFSDCGLQSYCSFFECNFQGRATFNATLFEKGSSFRSTTFCDSANFQGSTFKEFTYFNRAKFGISNNENQVSQARFRDCQFHQTASFHEAHFRHRYPIFTGATLHENTNFSARAEFWPQNTEQEPKNARDTSATLRGLKSKQGLPEDEHFFFRKEMHFAGRSGSFWQNLPYRFFGAVSDYGHSIELPARWLAVMIIALSGVFASALKGHANSVLWLDLLTGLGVSFSNTFRFFGFQKQFYDGYFNEELHSGIEVLAGAQTVVGYALLFFLGLGLRQRFRLR